MKRFLLIGFLPNIFAVERCPIYRESGWKLVRRTTENSFAATDNLDGTDVYGPQHQNVFGRFEILKYISVLPVFFRTASGLQTHMTKKCFQSIKGESFSMDFTGIDYDEMLFVTGDCQGWVRMDKSEFAVKSDGPKNVIETDMNPDPHQLFMTFQTFQGK